MPKEKKPNSDTPAIDADELAEFRNALEAEPTDESDETLDDQIKESVEDTKVPVEATELDKPEPAQPVPASQSGEASNPVTAPATKDMTTFDRTARRPWPWGWIIGGLFVLAIATVGGWLIFGRTEKFTGQNINLEMTSAAAASSGQELTVTVNYQNQEKVDLVRAELTIEYPDGFTYDQATLAPTGEANNAFSIGTIKSGRAGTFDVSGTLIGAVDTEHTFTATLTYRPANFNSDFQERTTVKVKITTSILELKLDGPTKIAPGANGQWTIGYKNTADRSLANIQVEAFYPAELTVTKTDPAARERAALWQFDKLDQGQNGTITITGTIGGKIGDSLEFRVRVGLVNATNTVDLQAEQTLLIILVNTGVQASVAVNGLTENSVVDPGETLNYTVKVTNRSDVELPDVTMAVTLDGLAVDFTTLSNTNQAVVKDKTLTWTKKEYAVLANLKPEQDVSVSFSVETKSPLIVQTDDDRNPQITATVQVTAPALNNTNATTPTTTFITKIGTVLKLQAEARYYNDQNQAVGSGPIPPTVAQTTTYRLKWSVTNSTSDANDMIVTAILPTGVFWTGQNIARDAGDITFDSTTRTVRWALNKVPAGTGSRLPALTATWDVSITPETSQLGSVVVLLDTSTAKVTDGFTSQALTITTSSLTTALPTDPTASNQGIVVAGT